MVFDIRSDPDRYCSGAAMRRGREWTKQEESFIVKEYPERSFAEIGQMIGRSRSAVKSKYQNLKLPESIKPQKNLLDEFDISNRQLLNGEKIPAIPCCLLWHLKEMETREAA